MFFQNYDDYMRDIFYFNGLTNNNMCYVPNQMQQTNLETYFPSIYRIIHPVIQRVIQNSNFQIINEDYINNLVNNVLGIIEGDISNMDNTSSNNGNRNTTSTNNNVTPNNSLLKDLIKILLIKELMIKQNIKKFPCNNMPMQMPYYQMPIYSNPYM